jgi:hypothetical protein
VVNGTCEEDALRSDARALGDCATNAALLQTKTELRSTLPCVRVQALRERFRSRYDSLDEVCVLQQGVAPREQFPEAVL